MGVQAGDMIVPLHNHSMYSALDGLATPEEIAKRCVQIGCTCCGLTDHGLVAGHLHFSKALEAEGVKPVFGCLFAGQPIITAQGMKFVEDIQVGDLVLTHLGRFRPVTRVMTRLYEGKAYDIRPAQSRKSLRLTAEHPVLARRASGDIAWVRADELIQADRWGGGGGNLLGGDEVCLPRLSTEDLPVIDVLGYLPLHFYPTRSGGIGRIKMSKFDRVVEWSMPAQWKLDEGYARLLGFYAAEGSAKANGSMVFSFNYHEREYAETVVKELARLGVRGTIRARQSKGLCEVTACCVPLAHLLRALCGIGSKNKRVPQIILESPSILRRAFLSGLADGDCKSGVDGSRTLKTSSPHLAWGFRTLIADEGYWSSVGRVGSHYAVPWSPNRQYSRSTMTDQYLYKKIGSIQASVVQDMVFNFEVAEDHSYVSDFTLHNCELYHGTKTTFKGRERDQAHLVALAMTDEGLRNLWRLVDQTARPERFRNVGRVFWDDLEQYKDGLVITSACALGMVPKSIMVDDYEPLNRYLDIFGDDFYIEIHTYPWDKDFSDVDLVGDPINMRTINEALVAIATERGIPLVYANDAHYAFPEQAEQHDIYVALQTGQSVYTPIEDRTMWHPPGALAMMDEGAVRKALDYLPDAAVDEALANSVLLGERAAASLPEVHRHLPVFVPSDCPWLDRRSKALSAEDLFVDLVEAGIIDKYGENASYEVWERCIYEVETLINDGIHHYFLMGWDEMAFADADGIERGPGRGSSAGCIVAYALGITDVDPLHYGLIFERFWNSGRADGFPDIDSDFATAGRDRLYDYLRERWGPDKVAAIGTVGRMKPKATVDKLARGCGIGLDETKELKLIIDGVHDLEIHGVDQIGWNRDIEPGKIIYVKDDVGEEIEAWIEKDPYTRRRFIDMCENACSRVKQYGIHASGIAISDVPLADLAPSYMRGGQKGRAATQFAMDDIDKLQIVKLDVLGLRTVDTLHHWRQMMSVERGIDIEWSGLDKEEHPEEMWDMLHEGFAAGIFQVEEGYPKRLCEQMNARSVLDIALIVALNRPGPIGDNVPDQYIARRNGEEEVTYLHPKLQELLAPSLTETYGLFVYQEQVINYFNALGYTLSESDAVRKILGKKKPEALAALYGGEGQWEDRGYLEMAWRAGVPEEPAQRVWEGLERFASYSFNKSHAVAYGILGFRTVFAKYYAPAEFYAACIRTAENEKREIMLPLYINEARRLEIPVYPPDIVKSGALAKVTDDGELYFGFSDVKGVATGGEYIEAFRDDGYDISSPEAFYDTLEARNEDFLAAKKLAIQEGCEVPQGKSPKQKLGANKVQAIFDAGAWDSLGQRDLTMTERQQWETDVLGVILTDNTAEVLDRNAEEVATCDDWDHMIQPWTDKAQALEDEGQEVPEFFQYKVCGIVTGVQEKTGHASGKKFGIVTVEYGKHVVEFMVFNNRWRSHRFLFKIRTPGIFTLRHTPATDQYQEGFKFETGTKLS